MTLRMPFLLLLAAFAWGGSAQAGWDWKNPFGLKPLPCDRQMLLNLYAQAGFSKEVGQRTFLKWVTQMPERLGLPATLVANRYKLLASRVDLTDLMSGLEIKKGPGARVKVSGGWGNDYTFLPNLPHWHTVTENFGKLVVRLTQKRGLDPILAGQIFVADHTSIADSGWVMATTEKNSEISHASVKITYFDYDMSPDGPWPRYAFWSALGGPDFLMYRRPRQLDDFQSQLVLEGYYTLKSSLDWWGLFPAELQADYRFPEHEGIFTDEFLMRHRLHMEMVLDQFEGKNVGKEMAALSALRTQHVPQAAREMAELGRFNIPPGSDSSAKAQLFYGLAVLLTARPIKTVVALSPRPAPPEGQPAAKPTWEIGFVQPGWGWLADIARQVGDEMDRERGINQEVPPEPIRDPLRDSYEALGLEVVKTVPYSMGLPNGCHVMRSPTSRFLRKIIAYQLEHRDFLRPDQVATIKKILEGLPHEE